MNPDLRKESSMVRLNNVLERSRRHQRARQAKDVDSAMRELQPELNDLVTELATAHLVRHGAGDSDETIAQNYIDLLNKADYQIIREALWFQKGFWDKFTNMLATEENFANLNDESFPAEETITVDYEPSDVTAQVVRVMEIVKRKLYSESR